MDIVQQLSMTSVLEAQSRLNGYLTDTPIMHLEINDTDVYAVMENLQKTGAYKARGAANFMQINNAYNHFCTASAGNHGLGVAEAAAKTNKCAVVFVPRGTPELKVKKLKEAGAEVQLRGLLYEDAVAEAKQYSKETEAVYVPAFAHPDIIHGQATAALHLFKYLDSEHIKPDAAVVQVGGGGLISGFGIVSKYYAEQWQTPIQLIGVQSDEANAVAKSYKAGSVVDGTGNLTTIADGIKTSTACPEMVHVLRKYVNDFIEVDESEIKEAIRWLFYHPDLQAQEAQISEGAGATGIAAILADKVHTPKKTEKPIIAAIVSGGNIDTDLLSDII